MGMTIDEAERYLRLMLGGMKYAVRYWKDRDKEESDIEQTNVEAVETALTTMRKYQQIKQIVHEWSDIELGSNAEKFMGLMQELVEDADRENGG